MTSWGAGASISVELLQQLLDENLQQQAEIEALKIRLDRLDGLGTEPVIVDEDGNLISKSLWVGFGLLITSALVVFRKKWKK